MADKLLKKENNSVIFFFWGRIRAELNNLKLFHHYKIAVRMIIKRVEVNISRLTSSSSCHKEFKPCIKCLLRVCELFVSVAVPALNQ